MFHYLDDTLKNILDSAPPNRADDLFINADISFETPEKGFAPKDGDVAINLFLYEVKENRELRQPGPNRELFNGQSVRQRAPLRVDCAYMVTAWSNINNQDNVANAHRLLGQAFNWLSRFPAIPKRYFPQPNLPQDSGIPYQPFASPTMVAQMDGAKSAGEFWHALGIPPRPYFNLVVTITMDLDQQIEDSIVTTISSSYQAGQSASADEHVIIGGTVRNKSGSTVADTWVRLEPLNLTQVTDASGRFIFNNVMRRGGLTLRARASGGREVERPIEIPSVTGEYDLKFA
jgi:hypothetical protein